MRVLTTSRKKPGFAHSLRATQTALFLALALIPLLVVAAISYAHSQQALSQDSRRSLDASAQTQASAVEQWVGARGQDIETPAGTARVRTMDPAQADNALRQYLSEIWPFRLYQAALLLSVVIAAAIAVMGAMRRAEPRASALACLMAAIADWSFFYALEMTLPGLPAKLLVAKLQYLGIVVLPLAWLVTAAEFSGTGRWVSRRRLLMLGAMPLATLLFVWTNEFHGLFWPSVALTTEGPFTLLAAAHGPWFWVHTTYSYALLVAGTVLLAREYMRTRHLYRKQALALLLSALTPWCSNVLYVAGLSPLGNLDLTPLAFLLTGLCLAWSVFNQHFFDLVPIAHNAVFANLGDPVIVLNAANQVVDANPAARQLIGKADAQVIGRPAAEVFAAEPDLVRRFAEVLSVEAEVMLHGKGGARVFDLRISPLLGRSEQTQGRLVAMRDITERHAAEEIMRLGLARERELSDLKSRFISMTSHEFRTPLSAIYSSAELLEYYGARWDETKKLRHLHQIQAAAHHMTQLLEDVLTIGRAEAGKLEFHPAPLDLESFCRGLLEEMERLVLPGQVIEFAGHGLEAPTWLDEKLLRQILGNLLTNAIKYSPAGGPIQFSATVTGAEVVLEVTDHGIGIPAEDQARLFETFHRATNVGTIPGTGLGLAILKNAVNLHGAAVRFASAAGEGTTFTVTLPVTPPLNGQAPVAAAP